MNPYTAVLAQTQLDQLRADADAQRLARAARSSEPSRSRFAVAVASLKAILTTPSEPSSFLPKLSDYPYRG